jgi:hypothetical protein
MRSGGVIMLLPLGGGAVVVSVLVGAGGLAAGVGRMLLVVEYPMRDVDGAGVADVDDGGCLGVVVGGGGALEGDASGEELRGIDDAD